MSEEIRPIIMLVDDNPVSLHIGKQMLKDVYEVYPLPSAKRLFAFLENVTPDLILLDVLMPDINGFEALYVLKATSRYADIPVIFVTSGSEEHGALAGLALGAVDYVSKPFSAQVLRERIDKQLRIARWKNDCAR